MREAYFDNLNSIIDDLVSMTYDVRNSIGLASQALLNADAEVAERVISADIEIDAARQRVEDRAFELLALQQPVARDLRMLVAGLRMVGDLERMGDLSVHVAKVARRRVPDVAVPDEALPTMNRMAQVAEEMVDTVAGIIADRDVQGARRLEKADDEMDQLRRSSFRLTLADSWPHGVEPAVDIALLGRYYERIADHAVSLARRVVYLVTGENHPVDIDV